MAVTPGGLRGTGETNVARSLRHIGSTPTPGKHPPGAESQTV